VFERYLGRSLLWSRALDVDRLTKIQFDSSRGTIQSWSWMAYVGGIAYLNLPFGDIDWTTDIEYRSPYSTTGSLQALRGRLTSSRNSQRAELRVIARPFNMSGDARTGSAPTIVWDNPTVTHNKLRCVIIGRLASETGMSTQKHWVLIVQELAIGLFERVGAGCVSKDKILHDVRTNNSSVV